jgi:protein O-GlcNAc transferase
MTKSGLQIVFPSYIFQMPKRPLDPATRRPLGTPFKLPSVNPLQRALGLHQQGRLVEAADLYSAILRTTPNQIDCLHYLGLVKHQMGFNEEAVGLIRQAIGLNPSDPFPHSNLGLALHGLGQYQAALDSYERALALNPQFVEAIANRGNVLRDLGHFDAALQSYADALALRPDHLDAVVNSAMILQGLGRYAQALECFDRAIALNPSAYFYNARGCMLQKLFRLDEALASFDRAIGLQGDYLEAWSNKGGTHYLLGQHQGAVQSFDRCIAFNPQSAETRLKRLTMRIPMILDAHDDVATIRANYASDLAAFSQWLDHNPVPNPLEVVGSCQPFYLAYHAQNNRDLIAPYGQVCVRLMAQWAAQNSLAPLPPRPVGVSKIRIGVASAHVTDHPVWTAIVRGWFQEIDTKRFELHVFHLSTDEDGQTALARARATAYHSGAKTTLEWAQLIIASEVDVLLYPELGMDQLTPQLAAMRLAHRQAATWGHPETTGLPTIDLYLSADGFEDTQAQACYTERLVPLPNLGCYYEPAAVSVVEIKLADLGIKAGSALLVCPGSPYKYAPQHDSVLAAIAKRVPNAQFLFFSVPGLQALSDKLQQRLAASFQAAGLDPARHLVVVPWATRPQFYSIMRQADVFLDTIGFSGFNTAMQAVDCALPIVTVEGKFMRGRFGSAILRRMGLDELVQQDDSSYVHAAVKLASDPAYKATLKAKMTAQRAVLYRDKAPVRALEQVLQDWCTR